MVADPEQPTSTSSSSAPPAPPAHLATAVTAATAAAIQLPASGDPRTHAAWRSWLAALADDAEAALAAAVTYEGLSDADRTAWLDALDADADAVLVPRIALYAPLLGVEGDELRRERILVSMSIGAGEAAEAERHGRAPVARPPQAYIGGETCVLVLPLYLDFVELLVCRLSANDEGGIASAHHEPLLNARDVPKTFAKLGAQLDPVDLEEAVEALAHAVVADQRAGRAPHPDVIRFSRVFDTARPL